MKLFPSFFLLYLFRRPAALSSMPLLLSISVLDLVTFTSSANTANWKLNKNIPLHRISVVDGPYLDIKIDINMTGSHYDSGNITVFKGRVYHHLLYMRWDVNLEGIFSCSNCWGHKIYWLICKTAQTAFYCLLSRMSVQAKLSFSDSCMMVIKDATTPGRDISTIH